ncbi:MAG: hypothetical protein C4287_23015 [Leptolyngbya sp. ERB_1_2]
MTRVLPRAALRPHRLAHGGEGDGSGVDGARSRVARERPVGGGVRGGQGLHGEAASLVGQRAGAARAAQAAGKARAMGARAHVGRGGVHAAHDRHRRGAHRGAREVRSRAVA